MKNIHRGFVGPLLLIIIAILLIGGGTYLYTQKNQIAKPVTTATSTVETKNVLPNTSGNRSWCHTFTNSLTTGDGGQGSVLGTSKDVDIVALRTALTNDGDGSLLIDGYAGSYGKRSYFDEQVATTVKAFQAKYGITKTGTVDPLTRAKLNSLYGCK